MEEEKEDIKEEKENKKDNHISNKYAKEIVFLIIFLILLAGCAGWFGNRLFSKSDTDVKEEKKETTNCLDFYSDPVPAQEEGKEENKDEKKEEKPATVESEWRSIGTDISKVKTNYELLKDYTYSASRARGGLSFFDEELFAVVLRQIKNEDLSDIEYEGPQHDLFWAKLSRNKVDSILKKTFGTNYNYEFSLNKNAGIDYKTATSIRSLGRYGAYSIDTYLEASQNFIVHFGIWDGITGPMPKITNRKVSEVFEKDDMIKVVERVFYYDLDYYNNNVRVNVYGNPLHTIFLDGRTFPEDGVENKEVSVDEFKDASFITSIFKKDETGNYIFISSELSNKPL